MRHISIPRFKIEHLYGSRIFQDPAVRPPFLDEMMPDIERLIASNAQRYADASSPHLQYEELVGEGRLKLSELITKGELQRQVSRLNFFKFLATAVANHFRSRVQKYRFTEKRTGQKPPPRDQRFTKTTSQSVDADECGETTQETVYEYRKNVDLSLDDPDHSVQVAAHSSDDAELQELELEYEALLTPVEVLVFRQLHRINSATWCYALEDAYRKKKAHQKLNVKVSFDHMALGIGLSIEEFNNAVLSLRQKVTAYRNMSDKNHEEQVKRNALIASLSNIFGIQIPPNLDDMVIRRLFTIAAHDQYEEKVKGNRQVAEMLNEVGAKTPSVVGKQMSCYGVLYQRNNRKCNSCDLRESCRTEAASVGLSKVTISPKLMRSDCTRVPAFLVKNTDTAARLAGHDEAEIIGHLNDTFRKLDGSRTVTYYHVIDGKRRLLFNIECPSPLRIKVHNPSEELCASLVNQNDTWYIPADASVSEVIEIIEEHAKTTFEQHD